jgi:hypothetical protein
MSDKKEPRFFYWEGGLDNWMPVDSLEWLLDPEAVQDGDIVEFKFKRVDMTEDEYRDYLFELCPDGGGVMQRLIVKCN